MRGDRQAAEPSLGDIRDDFPYNRPSDDHNANANSFPAGGLAAGGVVVPAGAGAVGAAAQSGDRGVGDAAGVLAADRRRDGEQFSDQGNGRGSQLHPVFLSRHDCHDPAVHGHFFDDFHH